MDLVWWEPPRLWFLTQFPQLILDLLQLPLDLVAFGDVLRLPESLDRIGAAPHLGVERSQMP